MQLTSPERAARQLVSRRPLDHELLFSCVRLLASIEFPTTLPCPLGGK